MLNETLFLCAAILVAVAASAFADDLQKAEKQIRMITAMSRDDIARSIIRYTFADTIRLQRPRLVAERKSLGLHYGGVFLVHELSQSGSSMEEIVVQLRSRKNIMDVASTVHPDWKRIASDAKKMNSRISEAIYKHFLHSKPDENAIGLNITMRPPIWCAPTPT